MRCLELSGSDDRMDCRQMFFYPLNPLPKKCPKCGFPDLDHVPQPYLLIRSRTMSPKEMSPAENGNFFVRPRVRQILELLAPGQCDFFPTHYKGTESVTPWLLAVPTKRVVTATVQGSIPRCSTCGEPSSAHPGSQYDKRLWDFQAEYHMLKSSTWGSSEDGWDKWVTRDLFMSVSLFHLLKTVKATGLDELTCGESSRPDKDEAKWIREKLQLLEAGGIPLHAAGTLAEQDAKWFRNYLKTHSRPGAPALDLRAVEQQLKFKLPKSWVEFTTKVGPVSFDRVDDQQGFIVRLLPPIEFDTQTYRAGALKSEDAETNAVDGVMFAETEHGDCLCFDVDKSNREFSVYLYKHEYNHFEPYADNFAACIRRLAGG